MTVTTVMVTWSPDIEPMVEWLREHVGTGVLEDRNAWRDKDIQWSLWGLILPGSVWHVVEFRSSEMATLFKLRWA